MKKRKTGSSNHRLRKCRRYSKINAWLFIISASLLVVQTLEKAADKKRFESSIAVMEAALYASNFAMESESWIKTLEKYINDNKACQLPASNLEESD